MLYIILSYTLYVIHYIILRKNEYIIFFAQYKKYKCFLTISVTEGFFSIVKIAVPLRIFRSKFTFNSKRVSFTRANSDE